MSAEVIESVVDRRIGRELNGRRLVAVDVENLLGCAPHLASAAVYSVAIGQLADRIGFDDGRDQMIVAANPLAAFKAHGAAPHARLLVREGVSGADRALCDELEQIAHLSERYDEIVIASGDHEFVPVAARLRGARLRVTVAARLDSLNGSLRRMADAVVALPSPAATLSLAA